MVTASHNPPQYNGMKLVGEGALPLSGEQGMPELMRRTLALGELPPVAEGVTRSTEDLYPSYVRHLHGFADAGAFLPLKVVMDAANGVAGKLAPLVFDETPLETVPMYFEVDGTFPNHEPNPLLEENSREIRERVVAEKADLGIAWDGDADRCFFIDEDGEFVPGDFVTALLAEALLARHPGAAILYDLRASRAVPDMIRANGGVPLMNRVGHAFFKQRMRREADPLRRRGLGPLLLPRQPQRRLGLRPGPAHPRAAVPQEGDDGGAARAAALALLHLRRDQLDGRRRRRGARARSSARFADGEITKLDGISVDYERWHFNVRPSNTEPLVRLNLGADSRELMEEKRDLVLGVIRAPERERAWARSDRSRAGEGRRARPRATCSAPSPACPAQARRRGTRRARAVTWRRAALPAPGRRRGLRHGRLGDRRRPRPRGDPRAARARRRRARLRAPGLGWARDAGRRRQLLRRHRRDAGLRRGGARARLPDRVRRLGRAARGTGRASASSRSSRVPGGLQPRASLGHLATARARRAPDLRTLPPCRRRHRRDGRPPARRRRGAGDPARGGRAGQRGQGAGPSPARSPCGRLRGRARRRRRRGAGRRRSTRTPRRRPSGPSCPSSTTTSSRAGRSVPHMTAAAQVVLLEDERGAERLRRRAELTAAELTSRGVAVARIASRGSSALARVFSLVQLGDYVSLYLALLYGVDPTPVERHRGLQAASGGRWLSRRRWGCVLTCCRRGRVRGRQRCSRERSGARCRARSSARRSRSRGRSSSCAPLSLPAAASVSWCPGPRWPPAPRSRRGAAPPLPAGALLAVADHVNLTLRGPLTGRWPAGVPRSFPCMTGIYQPAVVRAAGDAPVYSWTSSWPVSKTSSSSRPSSAAPSARPGRRRTPTASSPRSSRPRSTVSGSPPASSCRRPTNESEGHRSEFGSRHQGHRPRAAGRPAHRMGRHAHARPQGHPRALRQGEAARGHPHRRLPARHHRDGQPHAHPGGGRRGRRPLRQQPAEHPGRRRRRPRQRLRRARLRDQGRGRRDLLPAHQRLRRPPSQHHHGRRRRRHRRAPRRASRHGERHHRRHRRDDHGRDPSQGPREGGPPHVPGGGRQRGQHQAHVRQPLRHGAEHARRRHPRDQHPHRRQHGRASPATAGAAAASPCA